MGHLILKGTVRNAFLCKAIPKVNIKLFSSEYIVILETSTDSHGRFSFSSNNIFSVRFEKEGYITKDIRVENTFPEIIRMLENKIIGYQSKHSFKPGDEITAYVNSTENYKADLHRNGFEIEHVMHIGSFSPSIQEVPDRFFVDTGLSWFPTFNYRLPDNLRPGLYTLRITSLTDPEKLYNISFVVSPKPGEYGKRTKLLVLASTNNWQTYNIWGGRSRYRNFEKTGLPVKNYFRYFGIKILPESIKRRLRELTKNNVVVSVVDHPNSPQFKHLAINRPHPNCSINSTDPYQHFTSHLAEGEWRILAWLEREKYEYDVVSGFELHNDAGLLDKYNTIILNTHSEYWSIEMFDGLKSFYNNGGNILNLSGNSIYRQIEFYPDASLRCVSLKFNETVEDETQVLGVRFDMSGYGTCAPYRVIDPEHWIFQNTNLKANDRFGVSCLNNQFAKTHPDFIKDPASRPGMARLKGRGGSGWETDKLSSTAPADIKIIAKGANKFRGGADMIVREPDGHGLLFSASSITFGGTLLVDENSSKIVKNVLERINVRNFELILDAE